MSGIKHVFFFFIILTISLSLKSQIKWSFEFCGGAPYNLPATIKIQQSGYDNINISNADFYTEPFTLPPYWDWRFSRISDNSFFELEAIHHKLYLSNKPLDVQRFSISHGFNMFFINYGKIYKKIFFRAGIGVVFSHPETTIRNFAFEDQGEFLNTNYYLSGPILNTGISRRWYFLKRIFLTTEIKYTLGYASVPIALGHAKIFTSSFQFNAGLGFDFISKK